jgi:quercetin dioxygenase-like cupin family protein
MMNKIDPDLIEFLMKSSPSLDEGTFGELSQQFTEEQISEAIEAMKSLSHLTASIAPSPWVKKRLLDSIASPVSFGAFEARLARLFALDIADMQSILKTIAKRPAAPWTPAISKGIDLLHFEGGANLGATDCGLVCMAAGSHFPHHTHQGEEVALLLQGEVLEDNGSVIRPGDWVHKAEGSAHSFQAVGEQDAIFAVAVYGEIVFSG